MNALQRTDVPHRVPGDRITAGDVRRAYPHLTVGQSPTPASTTEAGEWSLGDR
ncbi:MAG: hypothetical protein J2P57_01330 [Acidimicrobiaceae bacterium]|nr:hypothetical protein [Acidimicrobiaceae bacterium]